MWGKHRSITFVAGLVLSVASAGASGALLVESSFETNNWVRKGNDYIDKGGLGKVWWHVSGEAPEVIGGDAPVCEGSQSTKVSLWTRDPKNNFRKELRLAKPLERFKGDGEYWIGFAIFIPKDWGNDAVAWDISGEPDDSAMVVQIKGTPDAKQGERWRNPLFGLTLQGGWWHYSVKADSKRITAREGQPFKYTVAKKGKLARVRKGEWAQFAMHVKFDSTGKTGFMRIWLDGKQVGNYSGSLGYNDARGPYFKMGNYKSRWRLVPASVAMTRVHYFDSLRIGDANSNRAEVTPNCGAATDASPDAPDRPSGLKISVQ